MNDDTHHYSDIPPEYAEEERRDPLINLDAEEAVLGTLFMEPRAMERVEDILLPVHFAHEGHARIYDLIREVHDQGGTTDPVSVKQKLELSGELERFGGDDWFAHIVTSAMGPMTAQGQAKTIVDLYHRRALGGLADDLRQKALHWNGDASELIEQTERDLSELVGDSVGEARSRHDAVSEMLRDIEDRKKNPGRLLGHSTGMSALDRIMKGLRATDLIVLAGRPSMGKTALVGCIARNVALRHLETDGEEGAPVLFYSLEMGDTQLYERLVANAANVPLNAIEDGKYHQDDDFHKVVMAGQNLANVPLHIDDRGGLTVEQIRAHARRMKRKWGIGLIVVDYLQIIAESRRSGDGRVNAVSHMTWALKTMAKELHVPVILLSQLSRNVETRDPPIPQLSDLRDSGSIEQDADVVMFAYREEYYLERKEPRQRTDENAEKFAARMDAWQSQMYAARNKADVLIQKNRKGKPGKATLLFEGGYQRFADLDRSSYDTPGQEDML